MAATEIATRQTGTSDRLLTAAVAAFNEHGVDNVTLDDIEALAAPALRHRLVPTFHAEAEGITVDQIIAEIIKTTKKSAARVL